MSGSVSEIVRGNVEMEHLMDDDVVPFVFGEVEGCAQTYLEVTVDGPAAWTTFGFVAHPAQEGCGFGEVYRDFGEGVVETEIVEVLEFFLGLMLGYFHFGVGSICTRLPDFPFILFAFGASLLLHYCFITASQLRKHLEWYRL